MTLGRTYGFIAIPLIAIAALAIGAIPAEAVAPASSSSTVLPPNVGEDISYPQCSPTHTSSGVTAKLPSKSPFAVVGLNGGIATDLNACFVAEYKYALGQTAATAQPNASVYINTGDPALAAAWWPSSNTTETGSAVTNPKGTCKHAAGPACAYVYGYSAAQADLAALKTYLGAGEIPSLPTKFWLDVETSNTWQYSDHGANSASLDGMVAYLHAHSYTVGIYSTSYQWGKIAGTTPSTSVLAGLPSWLAGWLASGANQGCVASPLTPGGTVEMLQSVVSGLDNDYACEHFPSAATTVSPTAPSVAGTVLTATHGAWASNTVTYKYQWLRNGVAIDGATGSTRTTTSSDMGKTVTVRIEGKAYGYLKTYVTSAGVSILGVIKTEPMSITGGTALGDVLTEHKGTWTPSSVAYAYQWDRDDVAIPEATGKTYTITPADQGHTLSMVVTATKSGYLTRSKSVSVAIPAP